MEQFHIDESVIRERWEESDVYGKILLPRLLPYLSLDFIREFADKIDWKSGNIQVNYMTENGQKFLLEFKDIIEKIIDGTLK